MTKRANNSLRKAIDQWLTHLAEERRCSPHTLASYHYDLSMFVRFTDSVAITCFSQVDEPLIERWLLERQQKSVNAKTIRRNLITLRSLLTYHYHRNNRNNRKNRDSKTPRPLLDIRGPKVRQKLPTILSVDEVSALLSQKNNFSARDHAMLEMTYSSGLRVSELVSLKIDDLDFAQSLLQVLGKRGKTRIVPLGSFAKKALIKYLGDRAADPSKRSGPVFLSKFDRALTTRAVQYLFAKLSLTSIHKRIHPHVLRHSCASHLLESSGELRSVQEFLGHENLSTTQIYTQLDFQQLAKVYDRTHPRAIQNAS